MGITNTIASSTSTSKAQQQSKKKQATMNKSVGLALLALVCLAQASAALPFSSPHSEAERLARAEHQLRLRLNELAMKERLAKLESGFPKPQTRTLQSKLDGEALFNHDDGALFDKLRKADEEIQAAHGEDLVDSEGRALLFSEEVLRGLGRGRALQVHNIARGINAASKATVVAGAVTDNKDMMKAGVAATAISGAAKIATKPRLGSPLGRAVRKGKRKLRRGVRRALRG